MPTIRGGIASRELRLLFAAGTLGGETDGELLARFESNRDGLGELAFGALVDRHGPMVLRVCRGLLPDPNDAEDAFQATFLVLSRKAGALRERDSIAPWLLGVARRVASRARVDAARRRRHEQGAAALRPCWANDREPEGFDPAVIEEVDRLPERFREPIVLCHLEGLTHEQAAQRLGWPVGTVRSRLSRGRDRLRCRLAGRGLSPLPALGASALPRASAGRAVRLALAESTTQSAARAAAGGLAAAGASPAALALAGTALRSMIMHATLKIAAAGLALGLTATAALGVTAPRLDAGSPTPSNASASASASPSPAPRPSPKPQTEAERIAEAFLTAGSEMFDAKDAAGLAASYTEDGEIHLISDANPGVKEDVKRGRAAVASFYRDLFDGQGPIDSKNTVEFARLISPEVLVVHGRFRPNTGQKELPFVQMRVKQGDRWLLKTLWLFLNPDA
ncbi:sigma-70 family RNA polymerase sigma factor [Tautonia sociabilis]|uniref:Sigma-70 family RNA polymerase sigma factor n=1 Tax=Tautonia sociabilis TaxID=2080755 RepID=A0A432MMI8_9BACT|nr:sigma-70 family RNA polymerase sigma factor [Tautonia sociabilis]RUL88664.1 sigma-70 family RNA polymerase sigma factor [Tautonia sociabilis]